MSRFKKWKKDFKEPADKIQKDIDKLKRERKSTVFMYVILALSLGILIGATAMRYYYFLNQ